MLIGTVLFLSLVVILLAVPLTLTYRLSWRQTLSANLRLIWAFGLVRAEISPDREKSRGDKPVGAHPKSGRQAGAPARKTSLLAAIRQPAFRRRFLRFVSDAWGAIHKQDVQLLVRLGLGDPADTGRLWAVIGPLSGMLTRLSDIRIAIEPDFLDPTLEVDSTGTVRIIPLQFAILAIGLLISPSVWRGIMQARAPG